jgi:D-sedoheptulose 7-phosphate isomerase
MELTEYIEELRDVLRTMTASNLSAFHVATTIGKALDRKANVFFCGNGGSAANASHIVNDLQKGLGQSVTCLNDNIPVMTAWANDDDYSAIYQRQLEALGETGDVLVVLSGSGDSSNIFRAAETAMKKGITVIGLLGRGGGRVKDLCNLCLIVPSDDMQFIEDAHLVIGHWLFKYLMERKTKGKE